MDVTTLSLVYTAGVGQQPLGPLAQVGAQEEPSRGVLHALTKLDQVLEGEDVMNQNYQLKHELIDS